MASLDFAQETIVGNAGQSGSACGYTEVYDLRILEGKDNLGTFLEVLFAD